MVGGMGGREEDEIEDEMVKGGEEWGASGGGNRNIWKKSKKLLHLRKFSTRGESPEEESGFSRFVDV